ncbi:hypothetical protein A9G48_03995 [Gilliamella sp. wkB18]|uniref:DUF3158 family protein n=1 Tax=Gilliamella sp. wkB18 TaxID=3120260 RepID=UPI00080E160D|nr:DUF3158 family protein [Gilliamella apicola]OCG64094.1 hypothetical protein A9G48_03995 [Gilliamella apicola]
MNEFYHEEYADTLSPRDYIFVKQKTSLKGLLKPFKGNREYETFMQEIEFNIAQLEKIGLRLINDTKDKLPIKYLPFHLKKRRLQNGAVYLTWKQSKTVIQNGKPKRNEVEGKRLILELLEHSNLSKTEKSFIRELEIDRLTLNIQMTVCVRLRQLFRDTLPKIDELDQAML